MKKTNKGFTLVELIIVIAILAIIMLIAIPNFSGIQQRMKVRADKSTAAQIGKAVRVWYTDYTSDPLLNKTLHIEANENTTDGDDTNDDYSDATDNLFMIGSSFVDYRELMGIGAYSAKTYFPTSLLDDESVAVDPQCYVVGLTVADTSAGKIAVAIVPGEFDEDDPTIIIPTTTGATAVLTTYKEDFATDPTETLDVDYDGTNGKYIAYVEP